MNIMKRLFPVLLTVLFSIVVFDAMCQKDFPDKIMDCIRYNDASCVADLLGKKVTISSINSGGATLLHEACRNKRSADVVKLLLSRGSEVNAKDNNGYTPLHIAALNGCYDIIKILIESGADKNAKDNDGNTPYDRAVWVQQTGVYELLKN